jgi:lipoprotein-releasing system ATP-binding protein
MDREERRSHGAAVGGAPTGGAAAVGAATGHQASGDEAVRLRQVTKSYGERVITRVLHGIDLVLVRGEFAALIGPSGSGKSTLLNLIGLLDRPTGGVVVINDHDTSGLSEEAMTRVRGREIGFIFQFHHLLPGFTALENVLLPSLAQAGRFAPEMRLRAEQLLREVGLAERSSHKPGELSGGQQQRVAIARALAAGPSLVLADEPTGNLDTCSSDQVFDLLRQINRRDHTTFLVVTHDARMAERCDRIIELVDGTITGDRRVRLF